MQETRGNPATLRAVYPSPSVLRESLASIGRSITAKNFASILDGTMRQLLHFAFEDAGASEGTVWLVEEATRTLVPAYNTGPDPDRVVGRFKQPLSAGLISMGFASEQPFLENQVLQNSRQDKSLDSLLSVQTLAMIAVPFYFLETCRGVVSCVQLRKPGTSGAASVGFDDGGQGKGGSRSNDARTAYRSSPPSNCTRSELRGCWDGFLDRT